MNAFNPLEATKRLQAAGITRRHAEAIASEINASADDHVTKAYFGEKLDDFSEKLGDKIEKLDAKINAALANQTVRNGAITAGIVAAATSVLGLLISIQ